MDQVHDNLVDIYMDKVKIDRTKLEELLCQETWLNAHEYLELGFVDEIKGINKENKLRLDTLESSTSKRSRRSTTPEIHKSPKTPDSE